MWKILNHLPSELWTTNVDNNSCRAYFKQAFTNRNVCMYDCLRLLFIIFSWVMQYKADHFLPRSLSSYCPLHPCSNNLQRSPLAVYHPSLPLGSVCFSWCSSPPRLHRRLQWNNPQSRAALDTPPGFFNRGQWRGWCHPWINTVALQSKAKMLSVEVVVACMVVYWVDASAVHIDSAEYI